MDKQALIDLVIRIQSAEDSEAVIDGLIDRFLENVPDPDAADYIFGKEYEELTPEEIVEKALKYKPFEL